MASRTRLRASVSSCGPSSAPLPAARAALEGPSHSPSSSRLRRTTIWDRRLPMYAVATAILSRAASPVVQLSCRAQPESSFQDCDSALLGSHAPAPSCRRGLRRIPSSTDRWAQRRRNLSIRGMLRRQNPGSSLLAVLVRARDRSSSRAGQLIRFIRLGMRVE